MMDHINFQALQEEVVMMVDFDGLPGPSIEIGQSSTPWEDVVKAGECRARKILGYFAANGWRRVEVAASRDDPVWEGNGPRIRSLCDDPAWEAERRMQRAGGGFVVRESDGSTVLLAEAFPLPPGMTPLFVEVLVLRHAMEKIVSLGFDNNGVVFLSGSFALEECMKKGHAKGRFSSGDAGPIVRECYEMQAQYNFGFLRWPVVELGAAQWLADCGMRCQQHCRWDKQRPRPPELDALLPSFGRI